MKGNAAELAIAAEAARLGLTVLMPITEHERYDLVLGISGRLFRVQCKWASRRGEVIQVRLRSSYHSPTRGYVVRTYAADEVDLVAVHCGDLGRSYLLPVDVFAGKGAVYLRLGPARNNQRASVHFAARYEFPGAVAQLAERLAGSEEARGSNPLSSIVEESSAPTETVGAHEFRNRFGIYLERAAAGAEILISRHGRPYARLVPAALKVSSPTGEPLTAAPS
jgi:prevent-host-death family protein